MGTDNISIHGRFKCSKEKYPEIKKYIISKLDELKLEPEVINEDNIIDEIFEEKFNYLELNIHECYGVVGNVITLIEKHFIKDFPDVLVELYYKVMYPDFQQGIKIIYDSSNIKKSEHYINIEEIDDENLDEYDVIEKFMEEFEKEIDFKFIK